MAGHCRARSNATSVSRSCSIGRVWRIQRPRVDGTVLEQTLVPGQNDARLVVRQPHDLVIVVVVAIKGIEAEQAQVSRQRAQMHVEHEPRAPQRPRPQTRQRRHIEALEHRVDGDPVAVAQAPGKVDRLAVDQHQIDLGVRHADRFDDVLDRRRAVEGVAERALAQLGAQEVVQLLVEAKVGDRLRRPGLRATTLPGRHSRAGCGRCRRSRDPRWQSDRARPSKCLAASPAQARRG